MAATVVDKLTVKLVGDTKQYSQAMKTAQANTEKFTRDAQGRYRNTAGQFVKMTSVIEQQANRLKKIGGQISSIGRSLTTRLTMPLTIFGEIGCPRVCTFRSGYDRVYFDYESDSATNRADETDCYQS